MDDAVLYMNVYYLGIIGNLIYNIGTGILRAIGDSRMPLYVLIVCCLANVYSIYCSWWCFTGVCSV